MKKVAKTLARVHTHTHTDSLENKKLKNIEKDSNKDL